MQVDTKHARSPLENGVDWDGAERSRAEQSTREGSENREL